jgi:hypothetical protein
MKITPRPCNCKSCECAIYTYEDSEICKACNDGQHLSGAKRKIYNEDNKKQNSQHTQ